ncbi:MAG: hypothetical protein EOR73_25455 [Mesorhizobium sp.]|nr:MAG: hypothetical protein EOR73_25455 [Mesorhizobium sp.]
MEGDLRLARKIAANPDIELSVHIEERAYRPPTSYPEAFFHPQRKEAQFQAGQPALRLQHHRPQAIFAVSVGSSNRLGRADV